jgi:catechol 2,3-dioxygenase
MGLYTLPASAHIGGVRLKVADLDRPLGFYVDLLGFQLDQRSETGVSLSSTGAGDGLLHLTAIRNPLPKPPRSTGLYHIAIRLPDRPALANLLERLLESRYPLQGAADHLVSEAIYLSDPDGNGLELYIDRESSQWRVLNGQVQMGTDPLDAQGLLAEARPRTDWTGIEPGTDIGHVHLQVSDLSRAENFYCGLLGFQVTQRSYPGALFVSAGGYHHHIGLNIWASRGAPPPPAEAVGLDAFRIAIPDTAAFTQLKDRLAEAERNIENPANKSFEILDPDSIRIEIVDTSVAE